jgi:DNA-binding CsgD family transcriptional regulator
MVGKKALSDEQKSRIQELNRENKTPEEIARDLGREKRSIVNYLAAPDDYGTRRYGTTSTVLYETKVAMFRLAMNDKKSPNEIKRILNLSIEKSQINNILREMGAVFKRPIPKQLLCVQRYGLTDDHIQERLEYCRQKMSFGHEWPKVVYTDEKLWYLNGAPGLQGSWTDP